MQDGCQLLRLDVRLRSHSPCSRTRSPSFPCRREV
jgi:hypothetical protein